MNRYVRYLINQFELHTEQYKRNFERKKKLEEKGWIVEKEYEENQCKIHLISMDELFLCIFSYFELSKNTSEKAKNEAEKRIDALIKDRQSFEKLFS